jgi:hypothetical protein
MQGQILFFLTFHRQTKSRPDVSTAESHVTETNDAINVMNWANLTRATNCSQRLAEINGAA